MATPPNRDLPEVVSELIIEMHEVRSELNALNGRVDRLERTVEDGLRLVREESRQNTDRLIEAFSRSMEPLINRILDHEQRLTKLENPQ
ncbi:MAG: hypothetical protein EOO56_00570 [Hymenobacter sp.]|nr:MAG: hypothetical protein EOO56_00570 [Hymenobacter sp.]